MIVGQTALETEHREMESGVVVVNGTKEFADFDVAYPRWVAKMRPCASKITAATTSMVLFIVQRFVQRYGK